VSENGKWAVYAICATAIVIVIILVASMGNNTKQDDCRSFSHTASEYAACINTVGGSK
jgi:hypothetical protein